MLRAIQFAGRFKFEIEQNTYEAIEKHAELITTVSPERIADELNKLLLLSDEPSVGFRIMQKSGLMKYILPELEMTVAVEQPGGYHAYDVFEHTLRAIDNSPRVLRVRLAAMFHDIAKPQARQLTEDGATFYGHEKTGARKASKVMRRLRYSNELIDDVHTLVERHMYTNPGTDKGLRRLIRRVTPELVFDLLDLRRADIIAQGRGGTCEDVDEFEQRIREELEKQPPFSVLDLALNGDDIMGLFNIPQSKLVGEALDYLLEKVLDEPADNTRERLIEFAQSYISNRKNENKITDR